MEVTVRAVWNLCLSPEGSCASQGLRAACTQTVAQLKLILGGHLGRGDIGTSFVLVPVVGRIVASTKLCLCPHLPSPPKLPPATCKYDLIWKKRDYLGVGRWR